MIQFHDAARYSILSFRATDTNRTYYVYSGNPGAARAAEQVAFDARLGAGPPQAPWVPRAGLVLTTLRRPEGANPMTSDEMAKLIAGSPTAYGARFQRRIADGYNPFGPSDMYMSVYRGWIRIPKAGRYEFCTASNEGSFSFLDGKELVHWPGRHTEERGRLGEFHAAIELAAGPHYIEYYHEEVYLQQMAFLGWRPPGAERFVGIPESLFTAPHGGEVLAYETPSGAAPRFEPVLMDSIWPETRSEGQYTRWAFRLAPALAAQANASWDFGDGQTSGDGMNARHVYLNAGHYPVRLTIGRTIVEWPLDVYELQHLTAQARQGNMGEYLTAARGYDRSRLDADGLRSWAHLLADAQKPEEALKAANEFLSRFGSAPSGVVMEVRRLASDCQLALGVGNADDAVAGFEATLASDLPLADKFKASARLILALGVERNWADRATNVFARVEQLTRDARIDAETQKAWRGVVIAAGDVELGRGRINAAQDYYRRAEKLREEFVPPQVRAARIGAWPDGVRQYLKKRDYAGALTSVDRWEDAFPLDKVRGETFFWRGKALLLSGQAAEAERPLSRAVELGLGAPFETEARWLRAGALDKLGRTEEARKELRRLLSTGLRDTYTDQAAKAVGGR
jgi:tetratricopeptide (TPR) repeat protein